MSGREGLLLNGEQDQVPLGEIVQLSQIRGDRNKVTTALKDSILQEGLLYPPIVASVSPALLEEYIGFTNRTWGGEANFDDFADRLRLDGNYYLMVAGHTRCAAVEELINEGALPANIEMPVKVVKMGSVMDIVSVQRADIQPVKAVQQGAGDGFQLCKAAFPRAFDVQRHDGIMQR